MSFNKITEEMRNHYSSTFAMHGASSKGVDWGDKEAAAKIRQEKMLAVINKNERDTSILDVGCGYGALADLINDEHLDINYSGIDIVSDMLMEARHRHPGYTFYCGDMMNYELPLHDYVVCNGIFTQKLTTSTLEMNEYVKSMIKKMYSNCKVGIAFNVMSTYVNYQNDNLYYRNPAELLGWCMSEISPRAKLDCAYVPWYEFTVYLYKPLEK